MQEARSWKTLQLRCPRYSSPGKRGQVGWPKPEELYDIDVLCKERHERFLRRTGLLSHAVLQSLIATYIALYSSVFLFFLHSLRLRVLYSMFLLAFCITVCFIVLLCCHVRRNKDTQ